MPTVPHPHGVCGNVPRGGGGEFVDAGSALGDALAVLAQPRPQVLGLGVGATPRPVGVGCPLLSWRALLVAGQPEGTWARLDAGPQCWAQAVSARSSVAVPVSALQWLRIVRAALVTVSAVCRTWVRSPPAQPAT